MTRWILVAFGVGILLGGLALKVLAPPGVQAQAPGPYQISSGGGSVWVLNTTNGSVSICEDGKQCRLIGRALN